MPVGGNTRDVALILIPSKDVPTGAFLVERGLYGRRRKLGEVSRLAVLAGSRGPQSSFLMGNSHQWKH